jgi:hypothetical protein
MVPIEEAGKKTPPASSAGRWLLLWLVGLMAMAAGLGLGVWFLRPDLLPQRITYDLIANRRVTERLVDPELLKVEDWEILGEEREVPFVHPAPTGSVALVCPVRLEHGTTFEADVPMAPEAWTLEGDGVTFSLRDDHPWRGIC